MQRSDTLKPSLIGINPHKTVKVQFIVVRGRSGNAVVEYLPLICLDDPQITLRSCLKALDLLCLLSRRSIATASSKSSPTISLK